MTQNTSHAIFLQVKNNLNTVKRPKSGHEAVQPARVGSIYSMPAAELRQRTS